MLKAGVSLVDISPEKGIEMAGYPHCPRPNIGVHDPLYAACLYLNNGKDEVVLVTLDLLYLGKKYVGILRSKFSQNIVFTTSHTHSGPIVYASTPLEKEEGQRCRPEYVEGLLVKLENAIKEAMSNTFDAQLGSEIGHCGAEQGVGGNRRIKNGLADPAVNVLAVKDTDERVRAVLFNYALHPTYLHAENLYVTADYPGYIRRFLSFSHPDAVFMFAQGTSGNQSSRYHRVGQNFEEAARVGSTLAVEIFHCLERMKYSDDIDITYKHKEIDLPMRTYPPLDQAKREMEEARAAFAAMDDSDYIKKRNCELAMFGKENAYSYSLAQTSGYSLNEDEELPCEVMTLKLGDTMITGIQGELFVEFGLAIKAASPCKKTFVFEVTNGTLPGYVYTKDAVADGGYEVGTSVFSESCGDVIVEAVKSLM